MNKVQEIFKAWNIALNPDQEQNTLASQRIEICNNCDKKVTNLGINRCSVCGCALKGKVFSPVKGACPEGKWDIVDYKNMNARNYIKNDKDLEIFTIENFLTDEECDYLADYIVIHNARSSVAGAGKESSTYSAQRTSSTSTLNSQDPKVQSIENKIYTELGIESKFSEPTQGQLYEETQFFHNHHDYFFNDGYTNHCLSSGQRTYTFMIYLNDVEEGGETKFPELDLSFKPTKGTAVVWKNSNGKGTENHASLHTGTPVTKGKKIIITKWFRENEFIPGEDQRLASEFHKSKEQKKNMDKVFTNVDDFPRFTEHGFTVIKCPEQTWNIIKDAYNILKDKEVEENFPGKEHVILGEGTTSNLLSFDHIPSIRTLIHEQLLNIHKEWSGANIEPSFVYGIRSYKKGAVLASHVDRIATHHISSIIIVDKDLGGNPDWALDVKDHNGNWVKVYAQPGDMILYESAVCEHGRIEPFQGNFFNNFYVHYKLTDYTYQQ
jgi:prolyl 4-hydroxylase